ncbi:MAG: efflux RND transporter permease subunit [Peptostreptococcaceae bacterium]|nr:efflux RND transporter permease subunit [Peptostreptococcaceae bacterium]
MSATLEMPIGSSKKDTIKMSDKIINNLMKIDDIETIGATDSTNSMLGKASDTTMSFFIKLKEDKKHSNTEIAKIIEERTKDFDCELKVSASNMDMGALAGSGIQVIIKGEDLDELKSIAKDISKEIKPIKGIKEITTGLENPSKETRIIVDKNKAMEYGLTTAQIYQTIANERKTDTSSTILTIGRNDYPVIVSNGDSLTKNELNNLTIEGTKDNEKVDVKISNIASISDDESLSSISRENQSRYMTVTATIDSDYNVGLVGKDVKAKLDNYKVKDGYSIEIGGEMETISDAMGDLVLMITLAVVFVYLVMVAQFQSLFSPFIVMFTIPLAFTGGLLALLITGNDLSVVSMLGFLVLSGVVVNNGIVFVDYVNQLRATGMSKKEAIIETGRSRIRPILMTALTTILAMSTMALSNGMGAEMTQGLAIVSIGGLAYSTILTLVVIPILYDLMQRNEFKIIDIED